MDAISGDTSLGFVIAAIAGYLFGSIPFGLVLTKLAGLGDIRDIGSGNIGATNVLRTGNKPLALITLILDTGKGAIAAFTILYFVGPLGATIAGVAAVIGHNFPIWLKFKGGKGVATTLGTILALSWPVGVCVSLTWLIAAVVFRMSSLSAMISLTAAPLYVWLLIDLREPELIIATVFLALLSLIRHHQNIRRIISGEEPKIGNK